MPLNDPNQAIVDVYRPRLSVQMNGEEIPFAIEAEINSNNWYQADRFHVEFALWSDSKFGPKFWSSQDKMLLDIRYRLDAEAAPGEPTSLIIGLVDRIDVNWHGGRVRVEGRDLTSNFIDHKVYDAQVNKTSSQIAAQFAAQYGMDTDIDTTTTPIGRFYESEHDQMSDGQLNRASTQWDLLTFLAQSEGTADAQFNVWVTGNTLHFKKETPIDQSNPWVIQVNPVEYDPKRDVTKLVFANATSLRMERSLTLAKDVLVVVRSWNSQTRGAISVVSGNKSSASATAKNPAQKYVIRRPNLTKDQAQHLADSTREQITRHERVIMWEDAGAFPGALKLTVRDAVLLQGTASDWDQTYYIDNIARHLRTEGGLTMSVKCKNHSTESQTSA